MSAKRCSICAVLLLPQRAETARVRVDELENQQPKQDADCKQKQRDILHG
jgi:hypothetical protein